MLRAASAASARRRRGKTGRRVGDGRLWIELACRAVELDDVRSKRRTVRLKPPEAEQDRGAMSQTDQTERKAKEVSTDARW